MGNFNPFKIQSIFFSIKPKFLAYFYNSTVVNIFGILQYEPSWPCKADKKALLALL